MPVYEKAYQPWSGENRKVNLRWLPMLRYHLKELVKRKLVWLLAFMAFVPTIIACIMIYIAAQSLVAEEGSQQALFLDRIVMGAAESTGREIDVSEWSLEEKYWSVTRSTFYLLLIMPQSILVLFLTSIVGSGLIASDLKSNALEIYLTKPMTAVDYVIGKLAVISIMAFVLTLVPSIVIFAVAAASLPDYAGATYTILFPITCCCLIAALVNGMVILGLSSLAKSARYATAIWFALCCISNLTASVLATTTKNESMNIISYRHNFSMIFDVIFGGDLLPVTPESNYEPEYLLSATILTVMVIMSGLIMRNTIRSVENR